jgi:HTH-type transcriptional regulator/antitoxin HigA
MVMTDIRPIHDERDYEAALRALDVVFDAEPGTPEGDRLEVLSVLIEAYENERHPIPAADPIATIAFYMEQNDLTVTDLGRLFGSKSHASEVLNHRRKLSLEMIRRLADVWKLPTDVLVRDTRVKTKTKGPKRAARRTKAQGKRRAVR